MAWLFLAQFVLSSTFAAPPSPRGSGVTPSERLPDLPAFEPVEPRPQSTLPQLKPAPKERTGTGPKLSVREFRIEGNTVFRNEDLAKITAPYVNRPITNEQLQELRHQLTLHYVNHGYITSGAVIPDQEVVDGIIHIRIIEGQLSEIQVDGNENLRPEYISDRLNLGAGPPLNINRLQEQIQIVLQDRNIEIINGSLKPGDQLGEAKLEVKVRESSPYDLNLFMDNDLSPSLGEVRGVLQGSVHNIFGSGDSLLAEIDYASGLKTLFVDYSVPVSARDTAVRFWVDSDDYVVQEEPFDQLDIEGDTSTVGFEVTHPFYRTPQQQLVLGVGMELRKSQTYLLGEGFAFSPGVSPDGESKISVLRFTQEWLDRRTEQVIAAYSSFRVGIDAFDATINDSAPDGRFVSWLGQFQWIRRVGDEGSQLHFRTHVQLANDELLPLEQFAVGGMQCARGYRKNQMVRDVGYCASLEYRVPVMRDDTGRSVLQLAPFADMGGARYKNGNTPDPRNLSSVGLGLIWDPHPKVHGELYWGQALDDVDNPTNTLQDDGIHFFLSMDLY